MLQVRIVRESGATLRTLPIAPWRLDLQRFTFLVGNRAWLLLHHQSNSLDASTAGGLDTWSKCCLA